MEALIGGAVHSKEGRWGWTKISKEEKESIEKDLSGIDTLNVSPRLLGDIEELVPINIYG